jgi:hypothetical protein
MSVDHGTAQNNSDASFSWPDGSVIAGALNNHCAYLKLICPYHSLGEGSIYRPIATSHASSLTQCRCVWSSFRRPSLVDIASIDSFCDVIAKQLSIESLFLYAIVVLSTIFVHRISHLLVDSFISGYV